jgi:hypothetical protein
MYEPDKGAVQQSFAFFPKWVATFLVAFRVRYDRGDELQDVFLGADVCERVVLSSPEKDFSLVF